MKISIITVCYNSAATLETTIISVKKQSYKNIEYIIIDGFSKDSTLNIVKKYEPAFNGRMHWVSESDKGLYDAMNKGIAMATGDIIGILNSDDTFYSNSVLEEVANFHLKYKIDASVGNIIQHNKDNKVLRVYSSRFWNPDKLKIGFMPPHPSIFFSKDIFKKFGLYNLGFKIGADYELITRVFLKNNISWRYSGITTTLMLVGGLSSSGYSSYNLISKEIQKALSINTVRYSPLKIHFRFIWKLFGFIKR
jgi:glycosyltransferase involved in cell wall biosynthesis